MTARMIDVAKLAGVSTMTVSRVLNDGASVTERTREKVFAAMKVLRYQPNELARSLRERRTRQIGVLVPYLFDPFFAVCANSISTVAKQHAYSVVLSISNENPQDEFDEASRMMRRGVEGLVLIPAISAGTSSLMLRHEFEHLPIVTLDRPIEGSRFDSLLVENERGARIGTEHLLSNGHRRIAYIGLPDDLYTMRMRHRGYRKAMKKANAEPVHAFLTVQRDSTIDVIRQLLGRSNAPTALFCANNYVTRHVLHALQSLGVPVPKRVALVGFDDFEMADLMRPAITVVRQPAEQLGRVAAEALFTRLSEESPQTSGRRTILPVTLVIRGSCGTKVTRVVS